MYAQVEIRDGFFRGWALGLVMVAVSWEAGDSLPEFLATAEPLEFFNFFKE